MRRILLIFTFLAITIVSFADIFDRPAEVNLVVDNANAFRPKQLEALRAKLDSFERATTVQIQIYTTKDLQGYDIVDFAQRLGEGWGVGQAGADNGIVIVYKPKMAHEDGEITIQTGYGIEPLIPDAVCKQIIEYEMIPRFKRGQIYAGIDKAVDICMSLTRGEFTAEKYMADNAEMERIAMKIAKWVLIGLIGVPSVILVIFLIVMLCIGGFKGDTVSSGSGSSSGSHHSSSSYHRSSHRSYGGGHFGGGGARGRW